MTIKGLSRLNVTRTTSSVLISLIIHLVAAITLTFYSQKDLSKDTDILSVDFVKNVPAPKFKLKQLRDPLKMKKYKPKPRENKAPDSKLSRFSRNIFYIHSFPNL